MENKKHIFLSYSRQDSKFALRMANDLKSRGFHVWIDQYHIPEGVHWDDMIEDALDNSCALIVIISPASVESDRVKDEVSYAIENDIHILPVKYKEAQIPYRWRRIQFTEIDEKNYSVKFDRFANSLLNFVMCDQQLSQTTGSLQEKSKNRRNRKIYYLAAVILVPVILWIMQYEDFKNVEISNLKMDQRDALPEMNQTIATVVKVRNESLEDGADKKSVSHGNSTVESDHISPEKSIRKIQKISKKLTKEMNTPVDRQNHAISKKIEPSHFINTSVEKSSVKKRVATLHSKREYLEYVRQNSFAKLVIVSHTNDLNDYDEAQKRAYQDSLDVRRNGLKRSRIVTKIVPDRMNKITYDLKLSVP